MSRFIFNICGRKRVFNFLIKKKNEYICDRQLKGKNVHPGTERGSLCCTTDVDYSALCSFIRTRGNSFYKVKTP